MSVSMSVSIRRFAAAAGICMAAAPGLLHAAEGGAGFYLLGSKTSGAGIMPPPGRYFQNDLYFYSGDLGRSVQLPTGGKLAAGVDGKAALTLPTLLWVAPHPVLGGSLGLSFTLPVGWKETTADLVLSGPRVGTADRDRSDDIFTFGDPVVSAMLGWSSGNLHWQAGTLINVPIGDYQEGELANISFNHWGADIYTAMTWLDPARGLDVSGAVGVTFNAENPDTDYRTGNEFHFEAAVTKNFSQATSAGIAGYYYDQLTGDSGDGALRPFMGRVSAVGLTLNHNFMVQQRPVSARIKYFHEFDAENRAEGDALFLTLTMPL